MTAATQRELDHRADAAVALAPLVGPILPAHGVTSYGTCTCGNAHCGRPGKHPARTNYKAMATTDPMLLRSYFGRLIPFNLALLIPGWLAVVDCDGLDAFDVLTKFAPWPITPTSMTRRGLHLFFRWPLFGDSRTVGGLDRVKLDVKGCGELVTLPPSTGKDGYRYHWRDGQSPFDIPIAPLPRAFAEHVATVARVRATRSRPAIDPQSFAGVAQMASQRAKYASHTSNGVGRGAAGLKRTLHDVGASAELITHALDTFHAEAGR